MQKRHRYAKRNEASKTPNRQLPCRTGTHAIGIALILILYLIILSSLMR